MPLRTLHTSTCAQLLELLKDGSITVEEYARCLLARIRERDSTVKAWAYLGKLCPSLSFPAAFDGNAEC